MSDSPDVRILVKVFTGMYPFSDFSKPVIVLKITDGERPTRPREAHELGLTDSVWNMTLRCWGQHPVHRPTVTEVVEFLREWSAFSLSIGPNIMIRFLQLQATYF